MMLQPFEEFKPAYIDRLMALGRRWLVSQTYWRATENDRGLPFSRINLLLSDYAEPGEARLHYNAVKNDRYASIIDLMHPPHLEKIREMLTTESGYRIFFAVVRSAKELENTINRKYKERLKQYVDRQTNWRISRDAVVRPMIQLSFGELFIILKHGSQSIRIKFQEIESE
jgi:hypothetical protein